MLWKKKRIYADAAAATPLSGNVIREIARLLPLHANPGGLHAEAVVAKNELESARSLVAQTLKAHSDEIVFTASGTEANNLAILGVLRPLLRERGEVHAITTPIEHASVLLPMESLAHDGLYLTELPVDAVGLVRAEDVSEAVTEETVLVSVQLVNSEIGTVQPLRALMKEVRRIRKERIAMYGKDALPLYVHTDASQAPLWLALSVESLGVDLLTLDAQKMLGPKGVGVLYVRRGTSLEAVIWGGGQERGLRSGTENVPLAGALAVALRDAQKGAAAVGEQVSQLRNTLIADIQALLPDAVVSGPLPQSGNRVANNVHVAVPGLDAQMAVLALDAQGVAAATRSACATDEEEPSHVLTAIGMSRELANCALRITLLPTATLSEVRTIARLLAGIAKQYKNVL